MASAMSGPAAIGRRIRMAREQAGLSQAQVAALLKVHRPTVSQIEAGDRTVKPDEIVQLAKLFGVKDSWIISGATAIGSGVDPRVELAARELSKLKKQDLDKIMNLLSTLRSNKEEVRG